MLYRLETYVPESAAESVKAALFASGAGKVGNYDHCCWTTSGVGCFRPLSGSRPAIGSLGNDESVAELKLELVLEKTVLKSALAALKKAHPYETPAFAYWPINPDLEDV